MKRDDLISNLKFQISKEHGQGHSESRAMIGVSLSGPHRESEVNGYLGLTAQTTNRFAPLALNIPFQCITGFLGGF